MSENTQTENTFQLTAPAKELMIIIINGTPNTFTEFHARIKADVESEVMAKASDYKNPKEMQAAITAIYKERVKETKKLFREISVNI